MTYDPNRFRGQNLLLATFAVFMKSSLVSSTGLALAIVLCVVSTDFAAAQTPPVNATKEQATKEQLQIDPNQLLLDSVKRVVWGPSLSCEVKQETNMFNQKQIGIGRYSHSGKGEGQLELGIRFSTSRSQLYYEQISDGRILWSWANDGLPPRRVYLDRVRDSLGTLPHNPQDDAVTSLYLAIGGQAGLLRSLYHRYRWYQIFAGFIDDQPCWEIMGTLRQQSSPPAPMAHAPYDLRPLSAPVNELVPTDARIRLVRGGELNLIPLQVKYFRRELDEKGEFKRHFPVCTIEYTDIHINGHFDSSAFAFQDHAANPTDETAEYLNPLPVAAAAPTPTTR